MTSETQMRAAIRVLIRQQATWLDQSQALLAAAESRVRAVLSHLHTADSARMGRLVANVDACRQSMARLIVDARDDVDGTFAREIFALHDLVHRMHYGSGVPPRSPWGLVTQKYGGRVPPAQRAARAACQEILPSYPGYLGTFNTCTPGGDDVDLRICFASLDGIPVDEIRAKFQDHMQARGIGDELEIFFMTNREFDQGIQDPVGLSDIAEMLYDGFDPHRQPTRLADASVVTFYIYSTMQELHVNVDGGPLGSPQNTLDRLTLTREGATDWAHHYTGCFVHDYLTHQRDGLAVDLYQKRLAKFFTRVTLGSTLAQLTRPQLAHMKTDLVDAMQLADASHSTDALMSAALLRNQDTRILLDSRTRELLDTSGRIRSGDTANIPRDFAESAEELLFCHAFEQGIDRRLDAGERPDVLTDFALAALVRDVGNRTRYLDGDRILTQGEAGMHVVHIPLKTHAGQDNGDVDVLVTDLEAKTIARYSRTAGRVIGEAAVFGYPRSATVTAKGDVEGFVIDAQFLRDTLADPDLHEQLRQPVLESREARRLDVLLRYLARESGILVRHALPYTIADRNSSETVLGANPLARYNLGQKFHDVLQLYATPAASLGTGEGNERPVTRVATGPSQKRLLFKKGQRSDRLYAKTGGNVEIHVGDDHEVLTPHRGEFFGESSILGLAPIGTAYLLEQSEVLSVDSRWFMRFTQSRQPINDVPVPAELRDVLPVHLLYHLAAEGYDRVRRRLGHQQSRRPGPPKNS